jgi:predicted dinucleotide-binding enzyme
VAYAVIGFGDAGPALASAFARKDIELSGRRSTASIAVQHVARDKSRS